MSDPFAAHRPCLVVPIPRTTMRALHRLGRWFLGAGSLLLTVSSPPTLDHEPEPEGPRQGAPIGGYL